MHPLNQATLKRRPVLLAMFGAALGASSVGCATYKLDVPAPQTDITKAPPGASETLVLAGGCFWGVQGVFQHVRGVTSAVSGYAGGTAATANYDAVSAGSTDHAEAVRVTWDPGVISYGRLLQIFFSVAHDPTELNFSGPDHGRQYRSALFPANAEQLRVARAYIAQLDAARTFGKKLATTLEVDKPFYVAEAHHQDYMTLHSAQPYILVHDRPKIEALKARYPELFRPEPVLVTQAGRR